MTFWILQGILTIVILWLLSKYGMPRGLWYGWAVGMYLVSTGQARMPLGGVKIDSQVVTVVLLCLGLATSRQTPSSPRPRWTLCDLLVGVYYLVMCISELVNGQMVLLTTVSLALPWVLPYYLGRVFLGSEREVPVLLKPLCICITIVSIVIVIQTFTGLNIIDSLCQVGVHNQYIRNGLRRGNGMAGHPISMGLIMVLQYPWAVVAAQLAKKKVGPTWWRFMPAIVVLGTLGTNSRGPVVALILTVVLSLFFTSKTLRLPIAAVALAVTMWMVGAPQQVRSMIDVFGDDTAGGAAYGGEARVLEIDGIEYNYTGTDHRWLLYKAYARHLVEGGLFGFGQGFSQKDFLDDRLFVFRSIDNYYVELQLSNGLVGLWIFMIMQSIGVVCLLKPAWEQSESILGTLSGSFVAALASVGLLHLTVSMLGDEKTLWSFSLGVVITISQLTRAASIPASRRMGPRLPVVRRKQNEASDGVSTDRRGVDLTSA
jgi:hypothetical protein